MKHEAKDCEFTCSNDACTSGVVMILDQIVIGTADDEIRKSALNQQWNLADLLSKAHSRSSHAGCRENKERIWTVRDGGEQGEAR